MAKPFWKAASGDQFVWVKQSLHKGKEPQNGMLTYGSVTGNFLVVIKTKGEGQWNGTIWGRGGANVGVGDKGGEEEGKV